MTIETFGNDVLIEQRFAPVKPIQRSGRRSKDVITKSGRVVTVNVPHHDLDGNPIWGWVIYKRERVVEGVNPWTGEQTSEEYIWMPVDERNTVEEARQVARELAGM